MFKETRKLARVVIVDDVVVHPNADALELAIIGGWQCCVKKDEFKKGDKAIYFEIDSLLPISNPHFAFLEARKEGLKEVKGQWYSRIRTIKLRKELSQGLLLPVPEEFASKKEDTNLTEELGVLKYSPPEAGVTDVEAPKVGSKKSFLGRVTQWIAGDIPRSLNEWPSFIQKTDQDRVQNKTVSYQDAVEKAEVFEISYKLDGSSFTAYVHGVDDKLKIGVCSRNYEIQADDVKYTKVKVLRIWLAELIQYNKKIFKTRKLNIPELKKGIDAKEDNFVKVYRKYNIRQALVAYYARTGRSIAVQGEMIGPGIQKNFEGNKELELYIFNVYDINKGVYLLPLEAREIVAELGLNYVPLLEDVATLPATVKECLELADGGPAFPTGKFREGLVFKSLSRDFSFKAISNAYLIKVEE